MCGIVGMFGDERLARELMERLKHLEYRGYDSAGVSVIDGNKITTVKTQGRVGELEGKVVGLKGSVGIAQTRWATHGAPSERNAHPHSTENFSLVHNGIVENHERIRNELTGVNWLSETDSEVALRLIERDYRANQCSLVQTLINVARLLEGASAIALLNAEESDVIYAIRKSSPLVVGRNPSGEMMIASDSLAFSGDYTEGCLVPDNSVVRLTRQSIEIWDFYGQAVPFVFAKLPREVTNMSLDGHSHFMHKEIHEQAVVIRELLEHHVSRSEGAPSDSVGVSRLNLGKINHIQIVGCGSAYHAGLLGKKYLELATRVPVTVELASEARYSDQSISPKTLLIAVSQSGETADTIACVEKAVEVGCQVVAVCNRDGSSLSRLASKTILLHCGPEVSVAATKSFTAMVVCFYLFSLSAGRNRGLLSKQAVKDRLKELEQLPLMISEILRNEPALAKIAEKYSKCSSALFVGRRWNYPAAMEGALKLKEISYIHAEGLASGELKHGTLALVTSETPIVAVAPRDAQFSKSMANIREIGARGGRIIGFGEKGDLEFKRQCEDYFEIPIVRDELSPIVSSIALQLLAYHSGVARGADIDRPRNLAKSVTVE